MCTNCSTHTVFFHAKTVFYRYYFSRSSLQQAQLVPFPFSSGRCTHFSDRLHDFSVTIPRCYKNGNVNSFFPRKARLWNSLPIKCFPLTYNLNGFKSSNRHLLIVGSFWRDFLYALIFFCFFFLVTPCLAVAVQPCVEWIPFFLKKKKKKRCHDIMFYFAFACI